MGSPERRYHNAELSSQSQQGSSEERDVDRPLPCRPAAPAPSSAQGGPAWRMHACTCPCNRTVSFSAWCFLEDAPDSGPGAQQVLSKRLLNDARVHSMTRPDLLHLGQRYSHPVNTGVWPRSTLGPRRNSPASRPQMPLMGLRRQDLCTPAQLPNRHPTTHPPFPTCSAAQSP